MFENNKDRKRHKKVVTFLTQYIAHAVSKVLLCKALHLEALQFSLLQQNAIKEPNRI